MNWYIRLKPWQQLITFLVIMGGLGTSFVSGAAFLERRSGILAEQFGFARADNLVTVGNDLKAWQLYSDIRRLTRAIYDIEGPRHEMPRDEKTRDLLADYKQQLLVIQHEYDRITKKK